MKNTGTLKVTAPTEREIRMIRVFQAPRDLVFRAFSEPRWLKRWFGPRGWSLETCQIDFRVGGAWRFVLAGPGGERMGMSGIYQEISPPARTVHTESYDDFPGESIVTTTLEEEGDTTILTASILYPSREVRDAVLQSGMEHGAAETYDKLAELLESSAIQSVVSG